MQQCCTFQPYFIKNDNNEPIGINLGYEYSVEHEFGIEPIYSIFNIIDDISDVSINKTKIRIFHKENFFFYIDESSINDKRAILFVSLYETTINNLNENNFDLFMRKFYMKPIQQNGDMFSTAWDNHSFCIAVSGNENVDYLTRLYNEFQKLNISIFYRNNKICKKCGLAFMIHNKIPDNIKESVENDYNEIAEVLKEHIQIGIASRIMMADLEFYSLKPVKKSHVPRIQTKYGIIYWLNPVEDKKYKAGWYSVEELEEWIKGRGPIIAN